MSFFKKTSIKTSVLSFLICAVAALNLLTLLFTVASGEFKTLSGVEGFFANGFTYAFGTPSTFVSENALWMKLFSLLQFIAALVIIIIILIYLLVKRSFDLTRLAIGVFIASFIVGIFYVIAGFVTYSAALKIQSFNYSCMTLVFLPMIFLAILIISYFLVKTQMPDNYGVKPERKHKRK